MRQKHYRPRITEALRIRATHASGAYELALNPASPVRGAESGMNTFTSGGTDIAYIDVPPEGQPSGLPVLLIH